MSTANDRSRAPAGTDVIQPDPLSPDVKIIESSCAQADNRALDNSRWTNILKQPIHIKKGSELRVSQSFIDMRGVDEQIVQFENTGLEQNNTHTMLYQLYTTNDGFNNKTTSYDYMARSDVALSVIDCGQGYTAVIGAQPLGGGDGNAQAHYGLSAGKTHGIRPQNIQILHSGLNYRSGETIIVRPTVGTVDATGYIITDDQGAIKTVVLTFPYIDDATIMNFTIDTQFGTNASLVFTPTAGPCFFDTTAGTDGLVGAGRTDATRGLNFNRNDIASAIENGGVAVDAENQAKFRVMQIYGDGSLNFESAFDQGYNYKNTPVNRWAQTFDYNSNYSYGNGLNNRNYTTESGQEVVVEQKPTPHQIEPCLSSEILLTSKEDELASGIFHTGGYDTEFNIFKPVLVLDNTKNFNMQFNEFGLNLEVDSDVISQNSKSVLDNLLAQYPKGVALMLKFELENIPMADLTTTQLTNLSTEFIDKYGGLYGVEDMKPNESGNAEIQFGFWDGEFAGEGTEYFWSGNTGGSTGAPATSPPRLNETFEVELTPALIEDGGNPPTRNPKLQVSTNGVGAIVAIYDPPSLDYGDGCRYGMVFEVNQAVYDVPDRFFLRFMLGGQNQNPIQDCSIGLTQANLTLSTLETVVCYVIPLPFYETKDNQSASVSLQKKYQAVYEYDNIYPATWDTAWLSKTSDITPSDNVDEYVRNGLYRFGGNANYDSLTFNPETFFKVNHDKNAKLTIDDDKINQLSISLSFGAGQDVEPASVSDYLNAGGITDDQYLKVNKANWNASYTVEQLPINTYLIIGFNTASEQHHLTGGVIEDATYYYITILQRDLHVMENSRHNFSTALNTAMGYTGKSHFISYSTTTNNYNLASMQWLYSPNLLLMNNGIECRWGNGIAGIGNDTTGSIGITSQTGFFGNNDENKNVLSEIYRLTPTNVIESYSDSGQYFLTHFSGILTTYDETQNINTGDFNDEMGFNSLGTADWLIGNLPSDNYNWVKFYYPDSNDPAIKPTYTAPDNENKNNSFSSASSVYAYEPLYREKTFTINKNFAIPTDIAGIWTKQSHDLTGALDITSGDYYTSSDKAGILQNEFVMPIYGSNNIIDPNGQYRPDYNTYVSSNGLEAGHCVGIDYLDSDNDWLATQLQTNLLGDQFGRKYYFVFFRTNWTFIRGYDPLKYTGTLTTALPDRTPLITVNTTADKIGNSNDSGSTSKKALDGSTMLAKTGVPATEPSAYELGTAGGVASGGTPVRFDNNNTTYPVRYLTFDKAKTSQYIGTDNITLTYNQNISTFCFEFIHQPFTSPFVDGQGGAVSARVFYGNRKRGIYNHETLGGCNVFNYACPEYPRGIFTQSEINDPTFTLQLLPNGVNPLTDASLLGLQFLEKIGFTSKDVGVINGRVSASLGQVGESLVLFDRTLENDNGTQIPISSFNQSLLGTTRADLDSSDAILSETGAPEEEASLAVNNQEIEPLIGKSSLRLLQWGEFIFYPYSLNTDSNQVAKDATDVEFNNASSTYGSVGGLRLSNSQRGMGLPNTVGSTVLVSDFTIPRTLNPDCNLYLAYTVACESSLKQASLLPRKLTNGYLVLLSSLIREPNFYMSSAGWVNAIATVNKTFVQGDFYLSQSETNFYAKEDFYLSEITTEIKDTNFGSPSTLGTNSTVVYSITNYNPKPERQQPTIEQEQQIDIQLNQMVQQHLTAQNQGKISPLDSLYGDFRQLGIDLLGEHNKATGDLVSAMRNQINYHDLPNLSRNNLTQFYRTPEGEQMLRNAQQMIQIRAMTNQLRDTVQDLQAPTANARTVRALRQEQSQLEKEISEASQRVRTTIPSIFYRPSERLEQQIPPLLSLDEVNVKNVSKDDFGEAIPYRYGRYKEYRDNRTMEGRRPVSFQEYQQFLYGNVLQPPPGSEDMFNPETTSFEPDLIQHLSPETLDRASQNPYEAAFDVRARATAFPPEFRTSDELQEEVKRYRQEVESGTADLSKNEIEILQHSGLLREDPRAGRGGEVPRTVGIGGAKESGITSSDKDLAGYRFLTGEQKTEAESKVKQFREGLKRKGRGRPTREETSRFRDLEKQRREYLGTLPKLEFDKKGDLPFYREKEASRVAGLATSEPVYLDTLRKIKAGENKKGIMKPGTDPIQHQQLHASRRVMEQQHFREEARHRAVGGEKREVLEPRQREEFKKLTE